MSKLSRPKKTPVSPIKAAPTQAAPLNYQSNYTANHQAVNSGQLKAQYAQQSQYSQPINSVDGSRGIQDLQNGMTANAQAQMGRQLEGQNAQKFMKDQMTRSELMQQGMANQAKISGDLSQRAISQMGLSAKLQEAQIRNNFSIANQQVARMKQNGAKFNLTGAGNAANRLMKGSLLK